MAKIKRPRKPKGKGNGPRAKSETTQRPEALKMAKYLFSYEREYTKDKKGRLVRVTTKDDPVTRDDIRFTLKGRRVIDLDEILHAWGPNALKHFEKSGYLRRDTLVKDQYWITAKCAENYALDVPTLANGARVPFPD